MARIGLSAWNLGVSAEIIPAMAVHRIQQTGSELEVETVDWDVEPWGIKSSNASGQGYPMIVASIPVTADFEMLTEGEPAPPVERNPAADTFECTSRWTPTTYSPAEGIWPASIGSEGSTMSVVNPASPPVLVDEEDYSFWDSQSLRYVNYPAVSFTALAAMTMPPIAGDSTSSFGCIGVWVTDALSSEADMIVFGDNELVLRYNNYENLTVWVDGVYMRSMDLRGSGDKPLMVACAYWANENRVQVWCDYGGGITNPRTISVSPPKRSMRYMDVGLLFGQYESSCELLDFAVWKRDLTRLKVGRAAAAYSAGFGV